MRILAIDQGSSLGWATNSTGHLIWGQENFALKSGESEGMRWIRFSRWLNQMTWEATGHPQIDPTRKTLVDVIVYEGLVRGSSKMRPNFQASGFVTLIQKHCAEYNQGRRMEAGGQNEGTIECISVAAPELKKFATGKGNAKKDAMVFKAMFRLNEELHDTEDPKFHLTENEADALWLFWWGKHKFTEGKC